MSPRAALAALGRGAAPIARDAIGLGGLSLIVVGVAEWSAPAAMILAGAMMTGIAALWAKRG